MHNTSTRNESTFTWTKHKKMSIIKAEQKIMLIGETSTTTICRIEYLVTTGLLIQQPYQCQGWSLCFDQCNKYWPTMFATPIANQTPWWQIRAHNVLWMWRRNANIEQGLFTITINQARNISVFRTDAPRRLRHQRIQEHIYSTYYHYKNHF